jgi:hypothetical protein
MELKNHLFLQARLGSVRWLSTLLWALSMMFGGNGSRYRDDRVRMPLSVMAIELIGTCVRWEQV